MRLACWFALALVPAVALGVALPRPPSALADEPRAVTVYVVRHAEKSAAREGDRNPVLTVRGMAQAADLADVLAAAPIAAVYSTPYHRTRMTGGPTAGARGLDVTEYRPGAAPDAGGLPTRATLLTRHAGAAILIVGHSNTVPRIVTHLGGKESFTMDESEYDNLIEVELRADRTQVHRHLYGPLAPASSPPVSGVVVGRGQDGRDSISGVVRIGDRVIVCADEGTHIQEWRREGDGYVAQDGIAVPTGGPDADELDLEGVAAEPGFLYVVGSHSLVRKAARGHERSGDEESYADNQRRLAHVSGGDGDRRNGLVRIPIDDDGGLRPKDALALDLRGLFEKDPFLRHATTLPGKENGLDIEGLAVDGKWLVLGLRGPVLRGNLTPIVRIDPNKEFTKVKRHRVSFIDLGGAGVRGLAECESGFLVLSGAVGSAALPQRLYHWDGEDMLPGKRKDDDHSKSVGRLTLLGTVPTPPNANAEGITVLEETDDAYTVLIVFDGAPSGAPTEFRVRRGLSE